MTIQISVGGNDYGNFTTANAKMSLDQLSGSFNFTAVSTKAIPLPFSNGEACKILVDGKTVITGFIENIDVGYKDDKHTIIIKGRDKTADVIDSSIKKVKISPPVSLKQAIRTVLDDINSTGIEIIEQVTTVDFNKAEEKLNGKIGEGAFDFIEKLARKRQVLLTRDGLGNIVITNGIGFDGGGAVQNIIGADGNNIKSANISYDQTKRFRTYIVKSQLNPVALNFAGETSPKEVTSQSGTATDEAIRATRQCVKKAENSSSSKQAESRAIWEANIRKARGRVYSCEVKGFRDHKGNLWQPNQIVQVVDEFCDINAKMLLNTVEFSLDTSGGSITTMGLVDSNAYTLDLSDPKSEKLGKKTEAMPVFDESRL
jgi:prophage tail gpP-like protein